MKRTFILALVVLLGGMVAKAQFFTSLNLMTPHYYPGEIYFADGHHEAYDEIELPRVGKSQLGVKKNKDDKKRIDIEAIDIVGIKIWHKDFPDKQHVLYYVHARKSMMQNDNQWGNPIAGSAWGVVYQCEQYYQMNKKNGDLDFVKFVGGNGPDTPTLYYLKRPGKEEAELIIINEKWAMRKKIAEHFIENEKIYEGIKSGKLKPSDIQYILDEMAGSKPAETPQAIPTAKETIEVETQDTQNGVVGDDE